MSTKLLNDKIALVTGGGSGLGFGAAKRLVEAGAIPTEGYETVQNLTPEQVQSFADKCIKEIPAGRMGKAEDIGDAVIFLSSDSSSFINGINLTVDGGQTQVYAGKL